MITINTSLVHRLKERDRDAWFELWDVFGPAIERMVDSLARRYFSRDTVQDIRQETLLQVFEEIQRFDAGRGVKFSTWLYAIARHIVSAELAHRTAQKRNRGLKPLSLSSVPEPLAPAGSELEKQVFRAKVYRAMKLVEKQSDFLEFEVYKMKICRPMKSIEIAASVGVSEASVSRYLRRIRKRLQDALRDVVREYSWTPEEAAEIKDHGLDADQDIFDSALGDIYASMEEDHKPCGELSKTARKLSSPGGG